MLHGGKSLDERLNQRRYLPVSMASRENERDNEDLDQLSDIYSVLRQDAKAIVLDLKGGVVMWREAAAGAAASSGFILILILTAFRFYPPGDSIEGWAYVIGSTLVGVAMAFISVVGFRKYFLLKKKYSSLFERAEKL
jgi:hypothetical protein